MDDAGAVRRIKRIRHLDPDVDGLMDPGRAMRQQIAQGLTLEQLHHQVWAALVLADVVNRADVGMVQRRCGTGFAAETLQRTRVGQIFRDELEGDGTSEAGVFARVHDTHPASAQLGGDPIVADRAPKHGTGGAGLKPYANAVVPARRIFSCPARTARSGAWVMLAAWMSWTTTRPASARAGRTLRPSPQSPRRPRPAWCATLAFRPVTVCSMSPAARVSLRLPRRGL